MLLRISPTSSSVSRRPYNGSNDALVRAIVSADAQAGKTESLREPATESGIDFLSAPA